jgi:Leucine-rich repeat (LRR) protein
MSTTPDLQSWWEGLSPAWRNAFCVAALSLAPGETPTHDQLATLWHIETLRFAGPRTPYPNMDFELADLSGLAGLPNLSLLVVISHQVTDIEPLRGMTSLRSLFLNDNYITHLDALVTIPALRELYFPDNEVATLEPLTGLTQLEVLYCCRNKLTSFAGMTEAHLPALKKFHSLPNDLVPQRDVFRIQYDTGILCLRG